MPYTKEDNERLTGVEAGTPGGELLRRYWHPVAVVTELSDAQPTKLVQLLGENLVLFKDKSGNVGLLADHCSHRGASLLYGRVEERGIACAYHGWLYDTQGDCLECPAEPAGSKFHLTVKHRAYPVLPHVGLYWAYLGPLPAPLLPTCDIMAMATLKRIVEVPDIQAHWLQVVENHVDGMHVHVLHQATRSEQKYMVNTTRGSIDRLASMDYWESDFGIMRKAVYIDGRVQQDAFILPNIRRRTTNVMFTVPRTASLSTRYTLHFDIDPAAERDLPVEHYLLSTGEEKTPPDAAYPVASYRTERLVFQDFMVMETQGRVTPREDWRLATSDYGLVLLHDILTREMGNVAEGRDPKGVVRDPTIPPIDTQIENVMLFPETVEGVLVYPEQPVAAVRS
jgi:5,5'-dehydrodivanillate O-demethylase oxygenase subunit